MLLAFATTRADADALFQSGRFNEAAQAYTALLTQSPRDPDLLDALGQTLLRMHQPRAAAAVFQREMGLGPSNRALHSMAAAFQEGNALEEGQRLLAQLTAADPTDGESWYRLGLLMYQNGYFSAAIDNMDRALRLDLGPYRNRAEETRAISMLETGRLEEAGSALSKLLAQPANASNLELLLAHARLLYEKGNYADALKEADLAMAADPDNAAAHLWRARIFQQQGRAAEAVSEAERARDLAPASPAPRNLLVRLYLRTGHAPEAAKEADWLRVHEAQAAIP